MKTCVNAVVKTCVFVTATLLSAVSLAYTSVHDVSLDADGIRTLRVRTYSGPLSIIGTDGDQIEAQAVIDFNDGWEDDEAREALEEGLIFTLDGRNGSAELNSWVGDYDEGDFSFFTWGLIDLFRSGNTRPFSHLEIMVPNNIDIEIEDFRGEVIIARVVGDIELRTGSGPVEITDLNGDLNLQDGSGEITLDNVTGNVEIRDGSGNIDADRTGGRLVIHDGSGNINIRTVGGNLDVRDGSGNIRITDLRGDGEIHDGSGEIDVRGVGGTLTLSDGSGSIDVRDVEKDVIVYSSGSGRLDIDNVRGEVINNDGRRNRGNYRYNYDYRDRDIREDIREDIDEDNDEDIDRDIDRR